MQNGVAQIKAHSNCLFIDFLSDNTVAIIGIFTGNEQEIQILEGDRIGVGIKSPVSGNFYLHINADVATVSMPALRTVGEYLYLHQNPELASASFPSLETVGQYLYVHGNLSLTTLEFTQSLTQVGEYTSITGNASLCVPTLDWVTLTTGAVNITGNGTCR